jgi:pseudouridylate synthase
MENEFLSISERIEQAIKKKLPIVALESAVITHGLPAPTNYELALELEKIVEKNGAIPATIAAISGRLVIGLSHQEINQLAHSANAIKVSPRNMAVALHSKKEGGTTVAGTIIAASMAGIQVFATGGIGGVHRNSNYDVSADLLALAQHRMVVVCAGAKAILDIPSTLEVLETYGVPVIGYQTSEFPAFYTRTSGLKIDYQADDIHDIAQMGKIHWDLNQNSAVLVTVPIPQKYEIERETIELALEKGIRDAEKDHIHGAETTPYLLKKMGEYTQGKTLLANLALLKNNAEIAAKIAVELHQ